MNIYISFRKPIDLIMSDFVARIDALCKAQKITRQDLAANIGLPPNTIAQWKIRESIPNAMTAYKIAKYFNTSVEYLLTGKDLSATDCNEFSNLQAKLARIEKLSREISEICLENKD